MSVLVGLQQFVPHRGLSRGIHMQLRNPARFIPANVMGNIFFLFANVKIIMDIEIVGFIGSGIIASALVPQVIKSWKTKSTGDISLLWNSLLLTGLIIFIIYGIGIKSRPIMIFTSIEASLTLSLLILKLFYKKP